VEPLTEEQRTLAEQYIPLAQNYARYSLKDALRCINGGRPKEGVLDELESVCYDGLMYAARRFEPERGVPFSYFARRAMRFSVLKYLASFRRQSVKRECPTDDTLIDQMNQGDGDLAPDADAEVLLDWLCDKLTDEHAEVLRGLYHGEHQGEIAKRLGLPVTTVMRRITRMRDLIAPYYNYLFDTEHLRKPGTRGKRDEV
jgi:RNA polymerase sigma-B factor